MTATSYALPAAVHLAQADNVAAEKAMQHLRMADIPPRHRALLATEVLVRHVTSRRRQVLVTAVLAEQAHTEEVAS